MNNDANPLPLAPIIDSFLTEMTEFMPTDVLATVNLRDAQNILDALPIDSTFRAALRDAFRDNIPCPDDTDIALW